jgi:hypothetical protein
MGSSTVSPEGKKDALALPDEMAARPKEHAYEIYRELDLGPGGYSSTSSTETRSGSREAIRRKHAR